MTAGTRNIINVIDLFAGCGGLTQGFHEFRPGPEATTVSPFRTVGAVEWDIAAASTYAANFADEAGGSDHIFAGDIKNWPKEEVRADVDVILGGPPCQGFSGLGKGNVDDPRNKLWREYMDVVNDFKPKLFVIENVDRFLRSTEFEALYAATEKPDGELRDYLLEKPRILNAADYGVPQARRRAIVLATRRDLIEAHPDGRSLTYPEPTHRRTASNSMPKQLDIEGLEPWVPVSTVFGRTPLETPTTSLPVRSCSPLGREMPGIFRTTELHIGRNPTPRSLERYRAIPPGGNRHDLPPYLSTENWMNHRTGSQDVMGRLHVDRPSVTIRTEFYKPEKGRYLHPVANRPITHYEAALLQGFPPDFRWCGSKIEIARQIGNAVPVGLARALAGEVYEYLRAVGAATEPSLQESA
jgi:DNA (cytosine-5)-methyltransferase 1